MQNFINKYIDNHIYATIAACIIVILLSIILYKIIIHLIEKSKKFAPTDLNITKRGQTYLSLIRSCIRIFFIIITLILILQICGVNVSSLLTGVGIIGIIAGLAIQDWLKDILRGSTIITDRYCSVGDIVRFGDTEGEILSLGIFTTKIRDIGTGNIVSIANRKIEEIAIVSNQLYVEIPVSYEIDQTRAGEVIQNALSKLMELRETSGNNYIKSCRYLGISSMSDFSICHLIEITCDPAMKNAARRAALKEIVPMLESVDAESLETL